MWTTSAVKLEFSGIECLPFIIATYICHKHLECNVNGAKGDGKSQGSCDEGRFCLSDGTCGGRYFKI